MRVLWGYCQSSITGATCSRETIVFYASSEKILGMKWKEKDSGAGYERKTSETDRQRCHLFFPCLWCETRYTLFSLSILVLSLPQSQSDSSLTALQSWCWSCCLPSSLTGIVMQVERKEEETEWRLTVKTVGHFQSYCIVLLFSFEVLADLFLLQEEEEDEVKAWQKGHSSQLVFVSPREERRRKGMKINESGNKCRFQ